MKLGATIILVFLLILGCGCKIEKWLINIASNQSKPDAATKGTTVSDEITQPVKYINVADCCY
jgi:hypothetical protein